MKTLIPPFMKSCRRLAVAAVVGLVAATPAALAQEDAQQQEQKQGKEQLALNQKLIVNIQDLVGLADFDSDFIRENMLETAFHNAADDEEWLGNFEFRYNYNVPADREGYLEFNLIDWERTPANMYECRLSATYRTVGGEEIELGSFYAIEPGIVVTTGWDVGEQFRKVAKSAFEKALDKLANETVQG